jgi:uncharacterized protein (DUF433 family)
VPTLPHIVTKSPDVLSGIPVFFGTCVPIKNLIDYLRAGNTIETFLDDFPAVKCEQVDALLDPITPSQLIEIQLQP